MKLCKDCKHATYIKLNWFCEKNVDCVTGEALTCRTARDDEKLCGLDGPKWEQRQNAKAIAEQATIKPIGSMYTENDPDLMKHIKGKKLPRSDYTPDRDAE